jgi:hypothetical protein
MAAAGAAATTAAPSHHRSGAVALSFAVVSSSGEHRHLPTELDTVA